MTLHDGFPEMLSLDAEIESLAARNRQGIEDAITAGDDSPVRLDVVFNVKDDGIVPDDTTHREILDRQLRILTGQEPKFLDEPANITYSDNPITGEKKEVGRVQVYRLKSDLPQADGASLVAMFGTRTPEGRGIALFASNSHYTEVERQLKQQREEEAKQQTGTRVGRMLGKFRR